MTLYLQQITKIVPDPTGFFCWMLFHFTKFLISRADGCVRVPFSILAPLRGGAHTDLLHLSRFFSENSRDSPFESSVQTRSLVVVLLSRPDTSADMDQDQRGQVGRERSPLSMEESREDRRIDSESSREVPVRIELEIGSGSGSDSKEADNKEVGNVGSLDNGGSSSPGLRILLS